MRTIQQMPGVRYAHILTYRQTDPEAIVDLAQRQMNRFRGPDEDEEIDYAKFITSYTLGIGSQSVPLDQCEALGDFCRSVGVRATHVRRAASREGGTADHIWQQQQLAYYPNLGVGPDFTGIAQAQALADAIEVNGGTVSLDRQGLMTEFFNTVINANLLSKIEMLAVFPAENEISARMDWRLRAMGTLNGGLTTSVDQPLTVDGVNDYFDHAWAPSSAVTMTGANQAMAVFVKGEIGQGAVYAAGSVVNSGTGQQLRINPDQMAGTTNWQMLGSAGFEISTSPTQNTPTGTAPDGLYWVQKNGTAKEFGRDGNLVSTATITTGNNTLSTRSMYTGGINNNGTAAAFKAGQCLATVVCSNMTTTEWGILSGALRTYFVAIGAMP